MIGTPGPQTIESIVAFWVCIPLGIITTLVTICLVISAVRETYDKSIPIMGALLSGVIAAGFIGGYFVGMYPDDWEHHHYQRYSGTVATTNSRLLGDGGGGTSQKFVVTFTESPNEPFGVLDTRAAVVRPGQRLTIDCVKQWQQAGTEGQDCAFVSVS